MTPPTRYEIVDTIAMGDFATVYRGRDRELGREVAIKQIHPQFLADPRQLARYWQEAQLLASLQHPNILTIYDIVRPRGWLILELMRGNLKQAAQQGPIDLDVLRASLIGCLNALQFLHANGVIHGDVKPSNILIGAQGRVKLGDFGLARRASNEGGSLLKGTTKYMAPELLSPQFGAIGPASDLYSLGFSAYELMCGAQFESLLPSLSTFGRDKQLAWMMWHATADMKLPEIQRILEGVPEDLAHVVQKLTIKDQARRYASAQEVLADLRGGPAIEAMPGGIGAAEQEVAAMTAKRKRRVRMVATLAMVLSAVLAAAILWPARPEPQPEKPRQPVQGIVTQVDAADYRLVLRVIEVKDGKETARIEDVRLVPGHDRVFVNDRAEPLDQVKPNFDARITVLRDESGRRITEVHAYKAEEHKGRIQAVKADEGAFLLAVDDGPDKGKTLGVAVPADLTIRFNGKPDKDGQPLRLAQLQPGDRAVARHIAQENGRAATELSIERVVPAEGVVADRFDAKAGTLSVFLGKSDKAEKFQFADQYVITVNGQPVAKPGDLMKGDRVTLQHDTRVVRVDALREVAHEGVVENVDLNAKTLTLQGKDAKYAVGAQCGITLGDEAAALEDLRVGDSVRIEHQSVEGAAAGVIDARNVAATRATNPARWAILIAGQNYDDRTLTPLSSPLHDAELLADALVKRYQVPPEQVLTLADVSLVRLEQGIPDWIKNLGQESSLVVYVTGHAYKDDQGKIYLAPKNFDLKRPAVTGLAFQWLVDQLEACPAKEKLLLLDTCHAGDGADLKAQPSTAEMLRSLKAPAGFAALRTVTAVASCKAGQRGQAAPDNKNGLFALALAQGYRGQADANRDNRLEPTELFGYLQRAMAASGTAAQTAELFLPNNRPPRLGAEAKNSIRKLAAFLAQSKIEKEEVAAEYRTALKLSGKEIEPQLLAGLILIKTRDRDSALQHFEKMKVEQPALLLPVEGIAWIRFDKRSYESGTKELVELVRRVAPPKKPGEPLSAEGREAMFLAGQLREFAAVAVPDNERPAAETLAAVDAAAASRDPIAQQSYQQGRDKSKKVADKFDELVVAAPDAPTQLKLKVDRRQLSKYVDFPFEALGQRILEGLDK